MTQIEAQYRNLYRCWIQVYLTLIWSCFPSFHKGKTTNYKWRVKTENCAPPLGLNPMSSDMQRDNSTTELCRLHTYYCVKYLSVIDGSKTFEHGGRDDGSWVNLLLRNLLWKTTSNHNLIISFPTWFWQSYKQTRTKTVCNKIYFKLVCQ